MKSVHLKLSLHNPTQTFGENGRWLDILLTGHNKSLVRPDCVDVPHPRSFVLDLTKIVADKTRSQLSQLNLHRQTGDHNLSSIAL